MYRCKSWTIKRAEHQRIDAFELWCWRRLLRVPWTALRANQSILKKIRPEYSLEGQMLKLRLQYFGHLIWRTDSLEKILMLGKTEERRRRGRQRMKWLDGFRDSMDVSYEVVGWLHRLNGHEFDWTPGVGAGQGGLVCCSPWGHKDLDTTERLNWTEPSCWGFSFVLGHGVSPHSRSNTTQPPLHFHSCIYHLAGASLPLDVGVSPHSCSHAVQPQLHSYWLVAKSCLTLLRPHVL